MLTYTNVQLNQLKVSELKTICKERGFKGYSTLNKSNLIAFIENNTETFGEPIVYVYNDNLNMYSIVNLNYLNLSIKDMTTILRQHVSNKMFSNQVMNEKELKACYRVGFRVRGNEKLSETEALQLLSEKGSIQLTINTTEYNMIKSTEPTTVTVEPSEVVEVETNQTKYSVGNKTFSNYTEAFTYCESVDFEPTLMIIETNLKDNIINPNTSNKQTNDDKLYSYLYTLRGFSLGCQPSDFISHNDNIGKHGIVTYDRLLTDEELSDYELLPYELYETSA